jgi:hypothetical protein
LALGLVPTLSSTMLMLGLSVGALSAPVDVLRKALAGSTKPYEGVQETRVYGTTGVSVSRVLVRGDGKGAVRREFQTGPAAGVVLIQKGASAWEKHGTGPFVRLPSSGSTDPAAAAASIAANYTLSVKAGLTFLGRKATQITIGARYPFNPSRTMLVDDSTGLVLRDEMRAPDGLKRSDTTFIRLAYGKQPSSLFVVTASAQPSAVGFGPASFEARATEAQVRAETGRSVPLPAYVPPRYRVTTYGVMRTGSGFVTPAVRYSDGLAAFTIFARGGPGMGGGRRWGGGQGPRRRGQGGGGWGPPGAAGALTSTSDRQQAIVTYTSRTSSYILIGDIAEDELIRVAKSLP